MATRGHELDDSTQQNIDDEYLQDPDPHQKRVEVFFKPLEAKWDFIRDVLLWKKPVYSLCIFIVVHGIFSYFASGNFRLFLIVNALLGLCLCSVDIRSKVASVLEQAGITPEERESYEASLIFQRFCYKIALIWGFSELQLSNLKELRRNSKQKFYALMVVLLVLASFAYQYLPWLKILYGTLLFLFLWPPAKYHGTHRVVIRMTEPFFRPFIVHWQHSQTKRQRNQILRAKKGVESCAEDSEDEFTKEFNPEPLKGNKKNLEPAGSENVSEMPSAAAIENDVVLPQQSHDTADDKPLLPQDAVNSIPVETQEDVPLPSETNSLHLELPESEENFAEGLETPGGSTVSFNSSASFLPDTQEFPSLATNTDTWDLDDDDLAIGLEFPDIDDKDYHSSTESLHDYKEKTEKDSQNRASKGSSQLRGIENQQVKRRAKKQTPLTSSQQSDIVTDGFELLDKSEIDDMDETIRSDGRAGAGTGSSLGNFVGKFLGL